MSISICVSVFMTVTDGRYVYVACERSKKRGRPSFVVIIRYTAHTPIGHVADRFARRRLP